MKITVFDKDAIGKDLDWSPIAALGECTAFESTPEQLLAERIADTEVAVINKIRLTSEVLSGAPKLKLICVAATGYDNVDIDYCRDRGIAVANVPAYSTDSVALVTVATVLSLATKLSTFSRFVHQGGYTASGRPNRLEPTFSHLAGKTWGIIGYGNIGQRVAGVARAFGCRVVYTRSQPSDCPDCLSADELCAVSDIITLSCPLNSTTHRLIDERRLALMKPTAILVNAARGAVCDEGAVAAAVKVGQIAAFGCDVYSVEPFGPDHPYNDILGMDNVCLTPHIAWSSFEARTELVRQMAENIRAFTIGEARNRVEC